MLTLYYKPSCPFCQRVIQVSENLKITLDLKDISDDESALQELIAKGGKKQVPFLIDSERNVSMYESNDIIDYLRENCVNNNEKTVESKPRVHVGGSVCESCEG